MKPSATAAVRHRGGGNAVGLLVLKLEPADRWLIKQKFICAKLKFAFDGDVPQRLVNRSEGSGRQNGLRGTAMVGAILRRFD